MTAYPHDSLLNLVTVFANETYLFRYLCIRSREPAEKPGNSVFTGTSKRTAGNRSLQSKADSTVKCYNAGWQRWRKWSAENFGKTELPANPMHVALYLQSLLKDCQQSSKSVSVIISSHLE